MLPVIFAATIAFASAHAAPPRAVVRDEAFHSTALGRLIKYRVVLPEGYGRSTTTRFPVLLLLHGLDGHYDDWSTRTHLVERASRLPLIVVMPEGGDSWYTNAADGSGRFEDYIVTDLIADVDARYRTIRARYGRAIAGLSMGGYGAIKLALKHPALFAAAASLSGAFDAADPSFANIFPAHTEEMTRIFGPPDGDTRRENDLFVIAENAAAAASPALYVDCGESDRFLPSNRRLVEILQKHGFTYEYHETAGAHAWDYWNRRLDPLLQWVTDAVVQAAGVRRFGGGKSRLGVIIFSTSRTIRLGLAARNAQGAPAARAQMLGEEHDLPDVIGQVRDRALKRLHDRVALAADEHVARQIVRRQAVDGALERAKPVLPVGDNRLAGRSFRHVELAVAMTVRLFAVAR